METAVSRGQLQKFDTAIALVLIIVGVSLRLVPHPANFAPITAIAIFGGAVLPRKLAVRVPLFAMMFSDAVIGFYSMMPITWACYAIVAFASSHWLRSKLNFRRGAILTFSASFFFFIVTNFAVWLTSDMYAHSWFGIVQCYTMAFPFFRNTFLSDAFYTAALFGMYLLAHRIAMSLRSRGESHVY